ncbi:Uncharacterised protein [Neisseria mucosa]|nr:Uncharacterised protein [Neisseria mucosa]
MIKAQEVVRDGVSSPAPAEAWLHGFNETVNARDQGRLKLPLKSHGYLLEIVSQWQGSGLPLPVLSNGESGRRRRAVQAAARCGSLGRMGRRRLGKTGNRIRLCIARRAQSAQPPRSARPAVVAEIWYRKLMEKKEIVSPEYDPIRIQTGFKVLQQSETWPQPAELLRNLPPRLIPRAMLAKPASNKEKGRQKMAEVKDVLNKKGH